MILAELYGKLSGSSPEALKERLEDALTSNVFGSLSYAAAFDELVEWLARARTVQRVELRGRIPLGWNERAVELYPWPKMPGVAREPDVLVVLRGDERSLGIVVEAKYDAPLSNKAEEEDDTDPSKIGNQLTAQLVGLERPVLSFDGGEIRDLDDWALVYLTKALAPPTATLKRASRLAVEKGARVETAASLHWLNWQALDDVLERKRPGRPEPLGKRGGPDEHGARALLRDVRRLLARKGLHFVPPFDGWGAPAPLREARLSWLSEIA